MGINPNSGFKSWQPPFPFHFSPRKEKREERRERRKKKKKEEEREGNPAKFAGFDSGSSDLIHEASV